MLGHKCSQVTTIKNPTDAIEKKAQRAVRADMSDALEYSRLITYRISQLTAKLNTQASNVLKDHVGLNMVQWRILALVRSSGPVSSSTLVKSVGMDAGLFSRNLKSMQELKLVKAIVDKDDQRKQLLTLTSAGLKYYERASPIMAKRRQNLTRGITATEMATLHKVLDKLEHNTTLPIK